MASSEIIQSKGEVQMMKRKWWQLYKKGWQKHRDDEYQLFTVDKCRLLSLMLEAIWQLKFNLNANAWNAEWLFHIDKNWTRHIYIPWEAEWCNEKARHVSIAKWHLDFNAIESNNWNWPHAVKIKLSIPIHLIFLWNHILLCPKKLKILFIYYLL